MKISVICHDETYAPPVWVRQGHLWTLELPPGMGTLHTGDSEETELRAIERDGALQVRATHGCILIYPEATNSVRLR